MWSVGCLLHLLGTIKRRQNYVFFVSAFSASLPYGSLSKIKQAARILGWSISSIGAGMSVTHLLWNQFVKSSQISENIVWFWSVRVIKKWSRLTINLLVYWLSYAYQPCCLLAIWSSLQLLSLSFGMFLPKHKFTTFCLSNTNKSIWLL